MKKKQWVPKQSKDLFFPKIMSVSGSEIIHQDLAAPVVLSGGHRPCQTTGAVWVFSHLLQLMLLLLLLLLLMMMMMMMTTMILIMLMLLMMMMMVIMIMAMMMIMMMMLMIMMMMMTTVMMMMMMKMIWILVWMMMMMMTNDDNDDEKRKNKKVREWRNSRVVLSLHCVANRLQPVVCTRVIELCSFAQRHTVRIL